MENNSVGDSGWGETKSHISGYDLSKVDDKPGLVLVTAGVTFCTIRFKPPCNYVGDLEYQIQGKSGSNQRKKYTRWGTTIYLWQYKDIWLLIKKSTLETTLTSCSQSPRYVFFILFYIYNRSQAIETQEIGGLSPLKNYTFTLDAWSVMDICGKNKQGCIFQDLKPLICTTKCNTISWDPTKMPEKVLSGDFNPFLFIKYDNEFLCHKLSHS